jgi:hypothetical protein
MNHRNHESGLAKRMTGRVLFAASALFTVVAVGCAQDTADPEGSSVDEGQGDLRVMGGSSGNSKCKPVTACPAGKNCGSISNGCGGTLNCGTCTSPDTCGGGGTANVCGHPACVPTTCAAQGKNCDTISDGCGGTLKCASWSAAPGSGCVDGWTTCAAQGKNCGTIADGCGGTLDCGSTCPAGQTCGGANTPNVCGTPPVCVPSTCAQTPYCGILPNGCGGYMICTCQCLGTGAACKDGWTGQSLGNCCNAGESCIPGPTTPSDGPYVCGVPKK